MKMSSMNIKINRLTDALDKIFLKESTQLSFVEGYSECYTIVMHNYGNDLYEAIKNIICEHIRSRIQPVITKDLCSNRLDAMIKKWEDVEVSARKFHDILLFLDLNYVQPKNLIEVYDMGLQNFRNLIIRDHIVSEAMQHVIFGMIIAERQGNVIDYSAIKTAVNLLLLIGETNNPYSEYDQIFEHKFLENSQLFYKREAQTLLQNNNAIQYIKTFETRLSEEKERVTRYLHERTQNKITELVENILIKENLNKIIDLDYGLNWMLKENCLKELKTIYEYYKKYSNINEFNKIAGERFNVYANSCIKDDAIDSQDKSKIIENLLNLKSKFDNFTKECFDNNEDLKLIYHNMFTIVLSSKPKISEYLACYIHEKMRKYEKTVTDSEIDKELDEFIELFKLVTEKDVFEKYARANLAKRLLSLRANVDIENNFIGKLQLECGNDFIKSLKNMTQDMTINETHMDIFNNENIRKDVNLPEIDFRINVLHTISWPTFKQFPKFNLPKNMNDIYELYLQCYHDKFSGRKVILQYNMGNTRIKAHYEAFEKRKQRDYMFEGTTTLHAAILDVFNNVDTLSFNEIQAKTNIAEGSLEIILIQFVKNKILNLEEKNDGLLKIYSVNLGFFSKNFKYKIKLNNHAEITREENEILEKRILIDRSYEIDAAICRVMKTRKTLKVTALYSEVIDILNKRFKPSVDMLKIKIKDLIYRKFIAYEENDTTRIIYIDC